MTSSEEFNVKTINYKLYVFVLFVLHLFVQKYVKLGDNWLIVFKIVIWGGKSSVLWSEILFYGDL